MKNSIRWRVWTGAAVAAVAAQLAPSTVVLGAAHWAGATPTEIVTLVGPGPVADTAPAAVQFAGIDIATIAGSTSAIAAGADAVVDVDVWNRGAATAAGPITLEIGGLPAGVEVLRADTDLVGHSWACDARTAVCVLRDAAGILPASLGGGEVASTRIRLRVAAGTAVASSLTLDVRTRIGTAAASADLDDAATAVVLPRLPDDVAGSLDVSADDSALVGGRTASSTITVTNLGPAAIGGAHAPVELVGVLPPGATAWRASGEGWTCAPDGNVPRCSWNGPEAAAGTSVDALSLEFTAPDAVEFVAWERSARALPAGGDTAIVWSEMVESAVLDPPVPDARTFASAFGVATVTAGEVATFAVGVEGSGFDDPTREVLVVGTLPNGWGYGGVAGDAGWTCASDAEEVTCRRSADFGGASASSLLLDLRTDALAATGPTTLEFVGSVTGPRARPSTAAYATVEVVEGAPPAASLRLWHYDDTGAGEDEGEGDEPGTARLVLDGASLVMVPGRRAHLGIDATNVGGGPIIGGTELVLRVGLPQRATVDVTTETAGPDRWTCDVEGAAEVPSVLCRLLLSADVALSASIPRARLAVTLPAGSDAGDEDAGHTTVWPVELSGHLGSRSLDGVTADAAVPVTIVAVAQDAIAPAMPAPPQGLSAARRPIAVADENPTTTEPLVPDDEPVGTTEPALVDEPVATTEPSLTGEPEAGAVLTGVMVASNGTSGWVWNQPPTFSLNDLAVSGSPVRGSRVRLSSLGTYAWDGPGPVPTDVDATVTWETCDTGDGDSCDAHDGGSPYVGNGGFSFIVPANHITVVAVIEVSGTDELGATVTTVERFELGEAITTYQAPALLVAPSATGTLALGNTLTGRTGEWTLEFSKDVSWVRCSDATVDSCSEIAGTYDGGTGVVTSTYEVTADDLAPGTRIRMRVDAHGLEWNPATAVVAYSTPVSADVVVTCGTACYTWSQPPTAELSGVGAPTPLTGFPASLADHGTSAWNDPSAAPAALTATVEWFECLAAEPTSCTAVGTGPSYTPTLAGVALEARLTLSGSVAEDGTVRTGTISVPFGVVADGAAPPVATTPPSITGTTYVGDTLTATPGVWTGTAGPARSYQWLRCPSADPDPASCVPIDGETAATYVVRETDLTEHAGVVRVAVTAPGYVNPATALSAPSAALTGYQKRLISAPTIDVGADGPRVGVAAAATQAVWSEMPATVSGPGFDWQLCTGTDGASCAGPVVGGTNATFTPMDDDVFEGRYLRVVSVIAGAAVPSGALTVTGASAIVGPLQQSIVPVTADTDMVGAAVSVTNAATVTVVGSGSGYGALALEWEQLTGPAVIAAPVAGATLTVTTPATGVGTLGFRLTVTDQRGNAATTDIAITYGDTGVAAELCQLVAAAATPGLKALTLGDFQITYLDATSTTPTCAESSVVTIELATVSAWGWLTLSPVSITATAEGLTIEGGAGAVSTAGMFGNAALAIPAGASLTIPFATADGGYALVGALVGSRPSFVELPSPWTGATRVAFGIAGGEQTIALSANAWDGSAGAATPVPGQLPVPPEGSPVVTLEGAVATDATFHVAVAASGVVRLAGATIDVAGSVTRSAPDGAITFAASGALAAPVTLAAGVVLDSAALEWDGVTFTGAGAATLTVNGSTVELAAAFAFSDPRNWSAAVSAAGSGSWSPIDGLAFGNPTATGAIRRDGTGTTFDVRFTADSVTVAGGVTATQPSLRLLGSCPSGGTCGFDLAFESGLTVAMFGSSISGSLRGTLNSATGAFEAHALLGAFTITDGLSFRSATLTVTGGAGAPTVDLAAAVGVLGSVHSLMVRFDDSDAVALVDIGSWRPFVGAPDFTDAWLVYAAHDTTVTIGDDEVAVPANSLQFAADAAAPAWFGDLIGDHSATARASGKIGLSPLTLDLTIAFGFDAVEVFDIGGVVVRVDDVEVVVTAAGARVAAVLSGTGTVTLPGIAGGAATTAAANATLFFDAATASVGGSIAVIGAADGAPAIRSAFGIPGLDIQSLSIAVGVGPAGPQLGLAGAVSLPGSWGEQIGILPGTTVTLAAALAGSSSCIGIDISRSGNTAIDVGRIGALTARQATVYLAPNGCTIGATSLPPGITMVFDGAILGTSVQVELAVNPRPLAVSASVRLGDIALHGLTVKNTSVEIEISSTVRALRFSGEAEVLGARTSVAGRFSNVGGNVVVEFRGTFASPDLGGFQVNDLTVDFLYSSASRTLAAIATLSVDILGQPQTVMLNLELRNGAFVRGTGTAALSLRVSELAISGTGRFEFVAGGFPTIEIDGTANVGGRSLTKLSARLYPGYLAVEAELGLSGVFAAPPRLSGIVAWQSQSGRGLPTIRNAAGDLVPARAGDFRFDATNIGLSAAGFELTGDVMLGRVSGTVFADVSARLHLGLAGTGVPVLVRGSFDGAGNITLTGTAEVAIAGVRGVVLAITVARQSGAFTVAGSGSIALPELGEIAVGGSFHRDPSHGTLFELTGTVRLRSADHDFGNAAFSAYRTASSSGVQTGMQADVMLDVPDLLHGAARAWIFSDGTFEFSAAVATQGAFGAVVDRASARVDFTRTTSGERLSFSVAVRDVMKIPGSFTLVGAITGAGSFDVSATVDVGPWSGRSNLGVCTAYYSASASMTVRVFGGPARDGLRITATTAGHVRAGCGAVGAGVGLRTNFRYTAPSSFSLSIQVRLSFGELGSWNPTVYRA